jgi:hypothetical protein
LNKIKAMSLVGLALPRLSVSYKPIPKKEK